MAKKKKRKTRVTKKEIKRLIEDRKVTSYQRKKKVRPGPWTEMKTSLEVTVNMRLDANGAISSILGPARGAYTREECWSEKGWYPIVFNIEAEGIRELVAKHGMDQFLAASEKYLNKKLDENGNSEYGRIIILDMSSDNSQRSDDSNCFISCHGKTNKKNISGFRAIRKKEYIVL